MPRPFFSYSYQQLEDLYKKETSNIEVLTLLKEELTFRSTAKAKRLFETVECKLRALIHPTPSTEPTFIPSVESQSSLSDDLNRPGNEAHSDGSEQSWPIPEHEINTQAENLRIPDDLERPKVFSKIRPPGTQGLPDAYERKKSQDISLDLPKDADLVDIYRAALSALILEIKKSGSGQKRYELENGVRVEAVNHETLYAFPFVDEAEIFEDAQVSIEIQGQRIEGCIVSLEAGAIRLSICGDFGSQIKRAVLLIDATALLEALKEKLEKVKNGQININRNLSNAAVGFGQPPQNPPVIPPHLLSNQLKLKEKQFASYLQALTDSVTRIWGPPGSGKTTTLGSIVHAVFKAGKRVLICSNTNKAVDQVLRRVCQELESDHAALDEGRVVRVGRIADEELKKQYADKITVEGIVGRRSIQLGQRKTEIEASIRRIDARTENARRILELFAKLDAARINAEDLQGKNNKANKDLQDIEDSLSRRDELISKLFEEREKRKRSRFVIFQRSLEAIGHDIAIGELERDRLFERIKENRTSAEAINQNLIIAQRELGHCISAVMGYDRNLVQREISEADKLRDPLVQELGEIETKIANIRASVIKDAKILGATCTKASLSSKELGQFDLVLIDEVSMIMPPMIYFVAGLSQERVIVCGDPRQIPPIVPTQQQAIFDVLGHDVLEGREKDAETAKLNIQYRMDRVICDLISGQMYNDMGGLRTGDEPPAYSSLAPPYPFDNALTIIDTSELWPFESVTAFRSRFNLMHALLARNLVWHLNKSGCIDEQKKCIGVCTPYAAQAKLIQKLLDGEHLGNTITAGTVHRYQGDEAPLMVLDVPESHGGAWNLGQFVQGVAPYQIGARLLNVAVTRAKSHLVVIANLTYLDKHLPSSSLLRSILYDMQRNGRVVAGRILLELRPIHSDLEGLIGNIPLDLQAETLGLFDEKTFDPAVKVDFMAAKNSIVIFSGFVTPRRVAEYGDLFRLKTAAGVKIRCVTRPPHLNGSIFPAAGKEALDTLEGVGCIVDCRSRIHQKVILIDDSIVWHGSLNALSHAHSTEESMTRCVNTGLAKALSASMAKVRCSDDKAARSVSQAENPRCKICGSRTVYAEGRYGPYFYCENRREGDGCDWSVNVTAFQRDRTSPSGGEKSGNTRSQKGPPCPKCGGQTFLRSGSWGTFYGCEHFPVCDGLVKEKKSPKKTKRARKN
ncbi:MAG: AAA family ATPase [Nitrospira sp.]|nr:MAG: AAA family ATPase [Nitrospira sp.]